MSRPRRQRNKRRSRKLRKAEEQARQAYIIKRMAAIRRRIAKWQSSLAPPKTARGFRTCWSRWEARWVPPLYINSDARQLLYDFTLQHIGKQRIRDVGTYGPATLADKQYHGKTADDER